MTNQTLYDRLELAIDYHKAANPRGLLLLQELLHDIGLEIIRDRELLKEPPLDSGVTLIRKDTPEVIRHTYVHDCDQCRFAGPEEYQGKVYDYYFCNNATKSMIMRYGNDGPDYFSWPLYLKDHNDMTIHLYYKLKAAGVLEEAEAEAAQKERAANEPT